MLWFVLIFLTIYTLMHLLVLRGIRPLLPAGSWQSRVITGWMLIMLITPPATRLLERSDHESLARLLAWIGYSWMGLLFLAFSAFAALAVAEILLLIAVRCFPTLPSFELCNRHSARVILFVTVITAGYGLFEARDLRVETVQLSSNKLAAGDAPLRIAQISDLHLGLINRESTLLPVIERLKTLQPDLLVVTGDLIDARVSHLERLSDLWRNIEPPLGKFAVIGNHEVYAELEQSLNFLHASGFNVLRQQVTTAGEHLTIVGVDDPALRRPVEEARLFANLPGERFILLLKHRPWIDPQSAGHFDLQLSGHAHRGQIFPFNLLTGLAYPLQDGLSALTSGGYLYTSRGTGTWGPPMRVLSPPEVTLIEIVAAAPED